MRMAVVLAFVASSCVASRLGPVPPGFEQVVVEQTETIPPRTDWGSTFNLNTYARLQIDYSIEPGRTVTYYLMTDEQYQRVVNAEGREPIAQGSDFIRKLSALQARGNDVTPPLPPTRYIIVMRNLDTTPVTVTLRAHGQRQ